MDRQPDENKSANCVPAALSSGLGALTGRTFDGDELKDAVYGQGYTGGTDPARYESYVAQQGVVMTEVSNHDGNALVVAIVAGLHAGQAVTGAIPSMWGNDYSGQDMVEYPNSTHEVLWCDDNGSQLTAMNPWGGFYQTQPYSWWAARIVYGRVFTMERAMLGMTQVSGFFSTQADGSWLCTQTGKVLAHGMLDTYRSITGLGTLAGLTALGLPVENESNSVANTGVQRFERGILVWDPQRQLDHVPGEVGDFYLAHIDDPKFNTQVASLEAAVAGDAAKAAALQAQIVTLQAQLAQAQHSSTAETAAGAAIRALALALAGATANT